MTAPADPETAPTPRADAGLKIYLGYASHTGKTWRILEEARRRLCRGQDVVVGWLRKKDEPALSHHLAGLEIIPPREVGGHLEMDCDAILERKPHVCIIDELAHSNAPGSRNPHRWQDVDELLAAGIRVVTAVNIQYVAGLQQSVQDLLGKAPEEAVPDEILRRADEVVLVDASKEQVLERPPKPSGGSPRSERDLLALREMALLYAARAVEENVQEYRQEHHIEKVWDSCERILVCLTAYSRGPHLIARAHQVATRWKGELWTVYVTPNAEWSNLSQHDRDLVKGYLDMAREKGARVEIVEAADPAQGILAVARKAGITQIFVGHAAAYPFRGALSSTVAGRIIHEAEGMDVHVVADENAPVGSGQPTAGSTLRLPRALARLFAGAPRQEGRGHERVYLGYAPGVGKTYLMLLDGQYLREHGQDVVVGFCQSHGRKDVEERLSNLEVIPPLDDGQSGLDVDAILLRRPQVCLVDDLARHYGEGRRHYVEVGRLLDAGIHVFSTLDITQVESLQDSVERIAGVRASATVPDWVVDDADEVVFVDLAVRALLNRVKRGDVFPEGVIPAPLQACFTDGSLNALRELAMRLTADRVEDEIVALGGSEATARAQDKTSGAVLVSLHERPSAAALIRRGMRAADRLGGTCYAVYVVPDEDWTGVPSEAREAVERHLDLARSLHVETHLLHGSHVARTLVDFATRHCVSQIVLGRSQKSGWREFFRRSVIEHVLRLGPWMDVHIVADR